MTQSSLTTAQVEQLRRDAKRLRRDAGITHAQALDFVASQHGYQNWSLLARNAEPAYAPREAEAPEAVAVPTVGGTRIPGLPRMDATRSEMATIAAIVRRFADLVGEDIEVDRLTLMMDLEACHSNGCPLDLVALHEAARDLDLVHDVAGIHRHLNRETGKLEDCFWPRYAMPQHALSA